MKLHFYLIAFLCFQLPMMAQNTYVPDDIFEQRLISLGYDSGPLDNYVPTANIAGVTSLDLIELGISDLTGIEAFTALEELLCMENNLTSLDMSGNPNLFYLNCGYNAITTINLSGNPLLSTLYIKHNALTSLNVSGNPSLSNLTCSENQLTSLNVSNNNNLTVLDCNTNQIAELTLGNSPSIFLFLCYGNQIANLNMSGLTGLQIFDCKNNQLQTLDVSDNPSLILFDASNNQPMTKLDIRNGHNTALSNANFSTLGNTNLTCIFVDNVAWSTSNWLKKDPASTFVATEAQCDALSTANVTKDVMQVYPNPVNSNFSISSPKSKDIETVEIYNSVGQKVKTFTPLEKYSIAELPSGIYFVNIKLKSAKSKSITIQKK